MWPTRDFILPKKSKKSLSLLTFNLLVWLLLSVVVWAKEGRFTKMFHALIWELQDCYVHGKLPVLGALSYGLTLELALFSINHRRNIAISNTLKIYLDVRKFFLTIRVEP